MEIPEVDELYGLPLGEFVPARDALAKQLRTAGRRDEAAAVRALRRPSVAAWTVNQLMRTQPREAEELFEAGDTLAATQAAVLAGTRNARDLRQASERQRRAVAALRARAAGLLDDRGRQPSAQTLERVAETLHAISLDPALRDAARAGRLVDAHRHTGLGTPDAEIGVAAADQSPTDPGTPAATEHGSAVEASAERARTVERDDAMRRAAQAARRAAASAAAARETAERRRDAARGALHEAKERRDAARDALRRAEERRDRARAALEEAEAVVAEARQAEQAAIENRRRADAALK